MDEIDQNRLAVLLPLMGQESLLALANILADGLAALAALPDAALADHLHRLRGSAASLGFTGLAARLADAEAGRVDTRALVAAAHDIVPRMRAALHALNRQR
jgi:HPt (histidine-containing phosphotransfer) domain-containing protein